MVNFILRVLDGVLCRRHLIPVLGLEVHGLCRRKRTVHVLRLDVRARRRLACRKHPLHVLRLEVGAVRRAGFSPWRLEIGRSNALPFGSTIVLWALLVLLAGADRGVVADLVAR